MNFSQLGDFFGSRNLVVVEPKPWMKDKKFTLVSSVDQLKGIVDVAIEKGECALDLETEGLDNRIKEDGTTVHKIVGYCLSYDGVEGFYVPVRHKEEGGEANLPNDGVVEQIKRLCENTVTIYHNSSFDLEFLYGEGIDIDDYQKFEDTLILDYLRDSSDKLHGLKHLSERFLGLEMIELEDLFPEGVKDRDFSKLDPRSDQVVWYAGSDAISTYLLFQFYKTHSYVPNGKDENRRVIFECLPESNPKNTIYGNQSGIYAIEKSCIPAIRWMERNRAKIDLPYLARMRNEVALLTEQVCRDISEGFKNLGINDFEPEDVSSAQKIGQALQYMQDKGILKVDLKKTEKSEQIQTDEEAIVELVGKVGKTFPFLEKISTFRKLQKVDGTYLKPLQENTDGYMREDGTRRECHVLQDSTIRFSFSPHRVDTGRFAASKGKPDQGYSGINVQSIPACYGVGKFTAKKVTYREPVEYPDGERVELYSDYKSACEGEFLIRQYDNHFVRDPVEDSEYCVRASCEGCPYAALCQHEDPKKVKILSLDSAVRPAIVARDANRSIVAIDESGVELRLAASISQEPKWIAEFYRCSSCGKEYPGPTDLTPDKPVGRKKYRIEEAPPSTCVACGSDKIGDLHTLTAILVYGEDVVNKPDFKSYRQNSKCVVGSTRVQTDRGLLRIRDMDPGSEPDEFVTFSQPYKVYTDDGVQEATHFYNGGVQDTVRIETRGRYSLEGTKTHRIRCFSETEGYCWRTLGDLSVGDYVVLDRGTPLHPDEPQMLPFRPFYPKLTPANENSPLIPMSEDWAYYLGLVTGDGTHGESSIGITYDGRETEFEQTLCQLLDRLGLKWGITSKDNTGEVKNIVVSSRRLSRVMSRWNVKDTSLTARIPDPVWTTGITGQLAFLRGYFDTDGHIGRDGEVHATSGSYPLLQDVQCLLASVGIFSQINMSHSNHPYNGKDYYGITISGPEAVRYAEMVGFNMVRKFDRLRTEVTCFGHMDKIPFPVRAIREDASPWTLKSKRSYEGLTWKSIDTFRDIYDFPEEILWLRDRQVRILPVTKIEEGREEVFDITVPGPESFWANGFINHNSSNFAILYGGGGGAVARSTGVSKEEGTFIKNRVLQGLPRLKAWFDEVHKRAELHKQVETGLGRKLRLADIDHKENWIQGKAKRNGVNGIIQGTATGDLTKYAMAAVYSYMKKHGHLDDCRLILTIHDELVFDIRNDLMDKLFPEIVRIMTQLAGKMGWPVPLACDIEFGPNFNVAYNWYAMHSLDPSTGKASEPVPKFLWNRIDMLPGMWYINDDGEEVVIPFEEVEVEEKVVPNVEDPVLTDQELKDPEPEEEHFEDASIMADDPPITPAPEDGGEVLVSETFKNIDRARYRSKPVKGPHFTFQLTYCPGQINGDSTAMNALSRTLYQIADFFHTEGTGTHILSVVSWHGLVLVDPSYNLLVKPDEFLVLARYFGLQGCPV